MLRAVVLAALDGPVLDLPQHLLALAAERLLVAPAAQHPRDVEVVGGDAVLEQAGVEQALELGLADYCVPQDQVRAKATELATEIAQSAPLAIVATRETLRRGLAEAVASATEREYEEQDWLRNTDDFREGGKAMARSAPIIRKALRS